MIGREEGAACGLAGCAGVIAIMPGPDCSCHISPPCSSCVEHGLRCTICDRDAGDDLELHVAVDPAFRDDFSVGATIARGPDGTITILSIDLIEPVRPPQLPPRWPPDWPVDTPRKLPARG